MKYLYLISFTVLLLGTKELNSQSRFDNKHTISLGLGSLTTASIPYDFSFSMNNNYKTTFSPIYHLKYEYGFTKKTRLAISISNVNIQGSWNAAETNGSSVNYFNFEDPNAGRYTVSSTTFVARFNWSFVQKEKVDVYFGTGFGYRYDTYKEVIVNSETYGLQDASLELPISIEASFGIRYYLFPKLGIYTELGLAKSFFQAGVLVGF